MVPFKENTIPIRTTRIGEDPSDEQNTLSGSEARWRIILIYFNGMSVTFKSILKVYSKGDVA